MVSEIFEGIKPFSVYLTNDTIETWLNILNKLQTLGTIMMRISNDAEKTDIAGHEENLKSKLRW